jgi:hypothetical protein
MPRFDLRLLQTIGNSPRGTVVPESEWVTWHNPGAYIEQHKAELLCDGEPVRDHLRSVLLPTISGMSAPVRRIAPSSLPTLAEPQKRHAAKKAG